MNEDFSNPGADIDHSKYEILRNMDSFTDNMFNRIIEFQERTHPAWDPARPFDERITELPLHCLVFSNPDRDPAVYGPTVAHYYPLRYEILKIARYAKAVADNPVIVDLHARNGFIGTLLAREGIKVIGVRDPDDKPNQIPDFYDPEVYELRTMKIADIDFPFDMAFSSWMPSEANVTPEILKHEPKLVVYVHTDHLDESTGRHQTGTAEAFTGLPPRYKLIDGWSLTREENMFNEIWPDLSVSIAETRQVKIYADEPYHDLHVDLSTVTVRTYDWEFDLEMATLALEAKAQLREAGFNV